MRYAMIMAGGAGTRLWPMSRKPRPKQLIPFIPDPNGGPPATLLGSAATRIAGLVPEDRRYICTAARFADTILQTIPGFTPDRILGEPAARDTVNAVGFAAAVFHKADPEAVFAVLTADHLISPQDAFESAMDTGFALAEENPKRLVTFGVTPDHPATGFGYIEKAEAIDGHPDDHGRPLAFNVARFVEKPPLHKAQEYLSSGNYAWNSGMFVFSAAFYMEMLRRHQPECHAGLTQIADAWGTPAQQETLDAVYPTLPKTSVDFGVMEPASDDDDAQICGVRLDIDWLDVGSWPSYAETLPADDAGNREGNAKLVQTDSAGNVVVSDDPSHTVALVGCEDLIVVRTKEATLVMPAERAQDLKKLHEILPDELK